MHLKCNNILKEYPNMNKRAIGPTGLSEGLNYIMLEWMLSHVFYYTENSKKYSLVRASSKNSKTLMKIFLSDKTRISAK